jgi:hypothetical protein
MAVSAHEDALLRFLPEGCDGLSHCHSHRERLLGRIDVVEVEVDDASVVSANGTAAAGLFDEHPLDSLKPTCNRLANAPLAAPAIAAFWAGAVFRELSDAMARAVTVLDGALPPWIRWPTLNIPQRNWRLKVRVEL